MSEPPALPPDAAAPASQPAPRRLVERRDRFFPPPPPPPARAARQRPDRQHAPAPPARPSLSGRPWGAVELRAGKWSAEEIAYADAVARDFRRGSLVGCPDGAMLRALLASLLNCTPMRVSKRFAGEAAMGKRAYVDDPAASNVTTPVVLLDAYQERSSTISSHPIEIPAYVPRFQTGDPKPITRGITGPSGHYARPSVAHVCH